LTLFSPCIGTETLQGLGDKKANIHTLRQRQIRISRKAVVRQLALLSHEGRSWTKRSSSPKTIHAC